MNPALQHELQDQLRRWQFFAPCPGTNVTVIDSAHGVWNGASGTANIDTGEPMEPGAQCYVYSITKTFTAIRILQLHEQGLLSLDDAVAAYLPETAPLPAVSIRQLLNHTGGIPSYTDLPDYLPANREHPSHPWSYDQVIERTCRRTPDFAPGTGWHYSNTGYMLLHRLIEVVSGCGYADNVRTGIVEPLGFRKTHAALNIDDGILTPGYCPYLNDMEVMEDVMRKYHPAWCLTGLIVSTTEEIASLYAALFGNRLMGAASFREMTAWTPCGGGPHPFFPKPAYGLGLMIDPEWRHGGFYGHGGDGPGFNTWAMHLPDFHGREVTLAVFCNATMAAHPYKLTTNILRALEKRM